jgi:hypothetical protein
MARSYDIHVRAVRTRKRADRASVSSEVRWSVAGQLFSKSFRMKAQADSAAADLRSAAKAGDAFDTTTGQPANTNAGATPWSQHSSRSWPGDCLTGGSGRRDAGADRLRRTPRDSRIYVTFQTHLSYAI